MRDLKLYFLSKSENKEDLNKANQEWEVIDENYVGKNKETCLCSHSISYVYNIRNKFNGNTLGPLGSDCILTFCPEDCNLKESLINLKKRDCKLCQKTFRCQDTYEKHLKSKPHLKMENTRPCPGVTLGPFGHEIKCPVRISNDSPEWMTRCLACYKKVERKIDRKNIINKRKAVRDVTII